MNGSMPWCGFLGEALADKTELNGGIRWALNHKIKAVRKGKVKCVVKESHVCISLVHFSSDQACLLRRAVVGN